MAVKKSRAAKERLTPEQKAILDLLMERKEEAIRRKEDRFPGRPRWDFDNGHWTQEIADIRPEIEYPRQFKAMSEQQMRDTYQVEDDSIVLAFKPRLKCSWLTSRGVLVSRVWLIVTRKALQLIAAGDKDWAQEITVVTEHHQSSLAATNTIWNRGPSGSSAQGAKRALVNVLDKDGALRSAEVYAYLEGVAKAEEAREEAGARDIGEDDSDEEYEEDEEEEHGDITGDSEEPEEAEEAPAARTGKQKAKVPLVSQAKRLKGAAAEAAVEAEPAAADKAGTGAVTMQARVATASGSVTTGGSNRLLSVQVAMVSGMNAATKNAFSRAREGANMADESNRLYAESLEIAYISARNAYDIAGMTGRPEYSEKSLAICKSISEEYERLQRDCAGTGAADCDWNASVLLCSKLPGT
jgi:hypothetical protein